MVWTIISLFSGSEASNAETDRLVYSDIRHYCQLRIAGAGDSNGMEHYVGISLTFECSFITNVVVKPNIWYTIWKNGTKILGTTSLQILILYNRKTKRLFLMSCPQQNWWTTTGQGTWETRHTLQQNFIQASLGFNAHLVSTMHPNFLTRHFHFVWNVI